MLTRLRNKISIMVIGAALLGTSGIGLAAGTRVNREIPLAASATKSESGKLGLKMANVAKVKHSRHHRGNNANKIQVPVKNSGKA